MSTPFLVVGLGNPGPTYDFTRHNVGFWAVADLADRYGSGFSMNSRQRAETTSVTLPGPEPLKLVLMKPTTYMNESGVAVKALATFHKIPADRVIVIHDELDLDPGRLRVKQGGGDNGHNGLKSIRSALGTGDFHRVRFGIGRPPGRQAPSDFVLTNFPAAVKEELALEIDRAADSVEALILRGLEPAQNSFNS